MNSNNRWKDLVDRACKLSDMYLRRWVAAETRIATLEAELADRGVLVFWLVTDRDRHGHPIELRRLHDVEVHWRGGRIDHYRSGGMAYDPANIIAPSVTVR